MKILFSAVALALLGLVAIPAHAALITYDLIYSGDAFGNLASGTGTITLDTSQITNPGVSDTLTSPFVTAFSLTITGAPSGNGTFSLADYGEILLDTNNGTLDFSSELVGQPTAGKTWGTPDGTGGDFAIFPNSTGNADGAPGSDAPFTIFTPSATPLVLVSFAPAAVTAPEPGSVTLLGLGLLGSVPALARRRRTN